MERQFKFILAIVLIFSSLHFSELAYGQPVFGRWVGVLHHPTIQKDQLAKLDFILSRSEENQLELMAVLTLHFGDFKSREYISYHYSRVYHHLPTGRFTFDQSDQAAMLSDGHLTEEGEFVANFHSIFSEEVGSLRLTRSGPVEPGFPIIEPVWGSYESTCGEPNEKRRLQLYTVRNSKDTTHLSTPFIAYQIMGTLGSTHPTFGDPTEKGNFFVKSNIREGTYNFHSGELILFGSPTNLRCGVSGNQLRCDDGCTYNRTSNETQSRVFLPPTSVSYFDADIQSGGETKALSSASGLSGQYTGYLHHEYLDTYQKIQLNIVAFQSGDAEKGLQMSALARLYFGDEESVEVLSYRFKTRAYPNPLTASQFILSQTDADLDPVLRITKLGDGTISGEWFSQLFGRVGKFIASKERSSLPKPISPVQFVQPLSGEFESSQWDLTINVRAGERPVSTQNPFYPLVFGGKAWMKGAIIAQRQLTEGTYDFYTGRIYFVFEREDRRSLFIGRREPGGPMWLKTFRTGYSLGQSSHSLLPFREVPK